MHSNKALRAILISIVLVLGPLTTLFIVPSVGAEPTEGETIFYFKDIGEESGEYLGAPYVSQIPPTKENDSIYPPTLLIKDTSRLLPRFDLNAEEFVLWLTGWAFYFLQDSEEFNLSELFGLFGDENLDEYDIDLFMDLMFQNPLRIVGMYDNDGEEAIMINNRVVLNLYFLTEYKRPALRDSVEIGLYSMKTTSFLPLPKLMHNTTVQITPKLLGNIHEQEIILENVSATLNPGDTLIFSIKLIPSDKPISKILENEKLFPVMRAIAARATNWIKNQENNTERPKLQELAGLIKEVELIAEDFNVTIADVAEVINAIKSSSFIYDSISHPSSVTVPFTASSDTEDTKVYYLHEGNTMDGQKPSGSSSSEIVISDSITRWNGSNLERNKVLKSASANLYINSRLILRKTSVTATLFAGSERLAFSTEEVSRDILLTKPIEPLTFTFSDIDKEIEYNEQLSLGIAFANGSSPRLFGTVKVLFDSGDNPSSLIATFDETDHIKIDAIANPSDEKIVPGGSVKYTLNITSKYDDKVSVDVLEDKEGDWDVTITEDQVDISAGGTAEVSIFVNSTDNEKKAYGDAIDVTFIVSGKTGIARQTASAEVSEDAIEYDVNIVDITESKNIKKDRNGTFYLIIKNNNTGAVDDVDSYTITVTSENNWEIKHTDSIKDLEIGEKTKPEKIFAIVSVPKNTTFESDIITITVTSDSNSEAFAIINVTVNVLGPNILESIYEFFESASNALGLDEMFGSYAPIALAAILMIIVLFIIIILALLLTRKSVNIVCTERIKEIDPDDEATFEIIIENPTRKTQTYEISSNENPSSPKWEKSIETEKITIDARQSKTVFLTVNPTEVADPNDWTETKVKVNILGKRKSEGITIMAMLKDGKTLLKITDVFTWPKEFKKGDRIITSFKLENKGNITARNVNAVLYINAKEKNKVEVTIPSGGYADVRMPWIAIKGKNKLHIKAIEQ